MRVEWLPVATGNLWTQLAYVGEHDPRAVIVLGDAGEAGVRRLADHPWLGGLGGLRARASWRSGGTPLVAVHRVETDPVVILRLLHGAQRWPESS